jgi:YegS/Rv2252/BmrU family lipid kinase
MRAAAILGLGCSPKNLKPLQNDSAIEWRMGMPAPDDAIDVVVLVGGDGTIHRHLSQLVRLQVPVLVVPAGSGNDFARALGLHRVRDALTAWRKFRDGSGNVRAIDLGVISVLDAGPSDSAKSPRYFCCVAGVGLDGEVARRANQLPRWLRGDGGYVLSMAPAIFKFAPLPMKILASPEPSSGHSDGWATRSDQPTLLAAFANTPLYGGGMKIAPQAKMDDGLLDVCIVGGVDPFKLFWMFPSVYTGRHLKIREVEYFQSTKVRVETEPPLDVYADGEYVCRTPIELSVHRAALNVVVSEPSFV